MAVPVTMAAPELVARREAAKASWSAQMRQAVQEDQWGQVVEAQEHYQRLAAAIAAAEGSLAQRSVERDLCHKLVLCLSARSKCLQAIGITKETLTAIDMAFLQPVLDNILFSGREGERPFPLPPHKYSQAAPVQPSTLGAIISGDSREAYSDFHYSHAAVAKHAANGQRVLGIRVDKWGLKDAETYIDALCTVMLVSPTGEVIERVNTPSASEKSISHVHFGHTVYLTTPYEEIARRKCALFYEFNHYKPKKKKVSTRCWCFMELDELKIDEELVLEIYHKPTDLRKKKLCLHSEKPLFLHLYCNLMSG